MSPSTNLHGNVVHIVAVGDENEGERLDRLLSRDLKDTGLSRNRIQALIRGGSVAEQGNGIIVTDVNTKVKPGACFAVSVPSPAPSPIAAQKLPLAVLYEDEALLVIDKPAGQLVHPVPGYRRDTLVNALLAHCGKSLSGIGGVSRPGIVHRLDKDTSGLLVVAKSDRAHQMLARQFAAHGRDGALEREYIALVWGRPVPDFGRIDLPIGRGGGRGNRDRLRMRVGSIHGKVAVTYYQVVRRYVARKGEDDIASRLICRLVTGRTHQIRAHLSYIGHPLLGDPLYGAGFRTRADRLQPQARDLTCALGRQALHAWRLGFHHPYSGKHLIFESPLPKDIHRAEMALALMQ